MPANFITVLVVEDHRDTLEVFGLFLESLGYRFKLAPDAGSALHLATTQSFDVLITDVQLGGRDGWALIRALREQGNLPPLVISMSAGDNYTQAARSKAEGAHAHLVKPFQCSEIATLLEEAVTRLPSPRKMDRPH